MQYKIISTGSIGNAVVIENQIIIDCGVSFKALKDVCRGLSLVLLTHIHSDHFNKSTIRKLAADRPTLRFACGEWLVKELIDCGVSAKNIDVLKPGIFYNYGIAKICPVGLYHNVPNYGYRIYLNNKKLFYATDTGHLHGIKAVGYDLYMIEANHTIKELEERIKEKRENGVFAYEIDVANNHLSKEQADDFIYSNIRQNGEYVYLHQHKDR